MDSGKGSASVAHTHARSILKDPKTTDKPSASVVAKDSSLSSQASIDAAAAAVEDASKDAAATAVEDGSLFSPKQEKMMCLLLGRARSVAMMQQPLPTLLAGLVLGNERTDPSLLVMVNSLEEVWEETPCGKLIFSSSSVGF